MQQEIRQRPAVAPAILGGILIVVGAAVLLARSAGINLFATIGPLTWPYLVIVPGLVLLGLALVPARPQGVGFAIAGSIVTTVGALLLYQSQTGHWESWSYAWALIPAAAGLAQVGYGLFAGDRAIVDRGFWMAIIGGLLFAVGAWFFEGLFAGEPRPHDLEWGPIVLIVLGGVIVLRGILGRAEAPAGDPSPPVA